MILDGALVGDMVFAASIALVSPIEASFCDSLPGEVGTVETVGFMAEAGGDDDDDDGVALELLILGDLDGEEKDDGGESSEAKTGGGSGGRRLRASSGSS